MAGSGQYSVGRAAAAIHDLGYKRYVGTRRPQSTRWRVMVRNTVSTAWRGWWRMKAWVIGAAMTTVSCGAAMLFFRERRDAFKLLLGVSGAALTWSDGLLPYSIGVFAIFGFLLASTTAAGAVARDLRAGAFEFYFSRPVRPVDYLTGKVVGSALVVGTAMLACPIVLALFRVGLAARDLDELIAALALVPRMALVGLLGSAAFATVALAFSSLSSRPRVTTAMWVAFYLLFGRIWTVLAFALKVPDLAALSLSDAVVGLAYGLFDVTMPGGETAQTGIAVSYGSLLGHIAIALVILHVRIKRAERAGLGGG